MDGGSADHAGAVICRLAGDLRFRRRVAAIAREAGSYSVTSTVVPAECQQVHPRRLAARTCSRIPSTVASTVSGDSPLMQAPGIPGASLHGCCRELQPQDARNNVTLPAVCLIPSRFHGEPSCSRPMGHGPQRTGSVGPNRATVGIPVAAATWVAEVSVPMNRAACRTSSTYSWN